MIHDEICTYELSKLAKEKGFNNKCYHYYQNGALESDECFNRYNKGVESVCSAPTQSLLQRWLRDNGFGEVEVRHWSETNKYPHHYGWEVKDNLGDLMSYSSEMFDTYELALEDAELYVLKNLL